MAPFMPGMKGRALEGQIDGLRGAGSEDDLRRTRLNQSSDLFTSQLDQIVGLPSVFVMIGRRVTERPPE